MLVLVIRNEPTRADIEANLRLSIVNIVTDLSIRHCTGGRTPTNMKAP